VVLPSTEFYEKDAIRTIQLFFDQPDHWQLLMQNHATVEYIPATLVLDGVTYDSVGVRFKGHSSFLNLPAQFLKRSFNISMDQYVEGQQLMGHSTINLHNAMQDPSFMREVIYLEMIRDHIPAAKGNFVRLYINGEDWGLYPNIQQLNGAFLREWFFNSRGSLWRARAPSGATPAEGTAALNYPGPDTTVYQDSYTLRRTRQNDPWTSLVKVCDRLNNLPLEQLEDSLPLYMDVDRTLWFLATEIAFCDDDSYVFKGSVDYQLYWDEVTGRMVPLEYDGNSVMNPFWLHWSPLMNAHDPDLPLLHRLMQVPAFKQRYLAHLRTIIHEKMDPAFFNALIDGYQALIDGHVLDDPKKLYTYEAFQNEVQVLRDFIMTRRGYLLAHASMAEPAPQITDAGHWVNDLPWGDVTSLDTVIVACKVASAQGVAQVDLYWAKGFTGAFQRVPMVLQEDATYEAAIPPAGGKGPVRWYVEAVSAGPAGSRSYHPPGAEHNVHYYEVHHPYMDDPPVRINEFMALNHMTITDPFLEFDDWIELYNVLDVPYDLGGHYLSDDELELQKWPFPAGTNIQPDAYLIVWADADAEQGPHHASFKLKSTAGSIWLSSPTGVVLDKVAYGQQLPDVSYARLPNGYGPFDFAQPSFGMANGVITSMAGTHHNGLIIHPNPASDMLWVRSDVPMEAEIFDHTLRRLWQGRVGSEIPVDVRQWANGTYFLRVNGMVHPVIIAR
jgi:hypothetical protein